MYVFLSEVTPKALQTFEKSSSHTCLKFGKPKRKALLKLADFQSDFSHTRSVTILSGGLAAI